MKTLLKALLTASLLATTILASTTARAQLAPSDSKVSLRATSVASRSGWEITRVDETSFALTIHSTHKRHLTEPVRDNANRFGLFYLIGAYPEDRDVNKAEKELAEFAHCGNQYVKHTPQEYVICDGLDAAHEGRFK